MGTIHINNKNIQGNNISITNGRVVVDGKDVTQEMIGDAKEITIKVEGNIESISCDTCESITVNGSSGPIKTMSGKVNVTGNVDGSIQTMSGKVKCGPVSGNIKTMSGDIEHN